MSRPFRHRLRVRYSECDAQGVVFNANYVAYFDVAMTELWRETGGPYQEMLASGTDMVVAEVRARYLAPARFDDEIDLVAEVVHMGNTSMTTRLTIVRAEDDATLVEGELRYVFVDAATGAKKPIPGDVREALEPYAAPVA